MKVGKKELSKKSLLLPWFLIESFKFFISYKALRFYDKCKIITRLLFKWVIVSYLPFYLWCILGVIKYFTGWTGELANVIRPFIAAWVIPLPVFCPVDNGNMVAWAGCVLFDVFWVGTAYVILNVMGLTGIKLERIDARWRKACLRVGLWTAENTTDEVDSDQEPDRKEIPRILSIQPGKLIIDSRGIVPDRIIEKKNELSAAMGCFIGNVGFVIKPDGSSSANLLEVNYSFTDLPGRVPFQAVPVCEPGRAILGFSWDGWQVMDFEQMVHMGISGETGSGKSVFLRGLITQIMAVDRGAVVVAMDFKGGAELSYFSEFGNLICIDEIRQAGPALELVYKEYQARVKIVRQNVCDSIYELRRKAGLYIPPLICIIDEAAEMFGQKQSGKAIELIDRLIRLGRFVGIHLIIATQRADANVIPTSIRSMLTTRVIFKVTQKEDSIVFIGNGSASKLRRIPGRFLFRGPDGNLKECQAAYLSKSESQEILKRLPAAEASELVEGLKRIEQEQESYGLAEVGRWPGGQELGQVAEVAGGGWQVAEVA